MTPHQKRSLSPLVKRLAEDLKIRNRAQATIDAYTFHVGRFEEFLLCAVELWSEGRRRMCGDFS